MRHHLLVLLTSLAVNVFAQPAFAEPWTNPFASTYGEGPGLLSVGLHLGSVHAQGLGIEVGVTALPWLEVKASYGYWVEHSVAGFIKWNVLPRAMLEPYFVTGYDLALSKLKYGISLRTHQLVAGAGLQARLTDHIYLGGEVTANVVLGQTLIEKTATYDVGISDRVVVAVGFVVGVWLF